MKRGAPCEYFLSWSKGSEKKSMSDKLRHGEYRGTEGQLSIRLIGVKKELGGCAKRKRGSRNLRRGTYHLGRVRSKEEKPAYWEAKNQELGVYTRVTCRWMGGMPAVCSIDRNLGDQEVNKIGQNGRLSEKNYFAAVFEKTREGYGEKDSWGGGTTEDTGGV